MFNQVVKTFGTSCCWSTCCDGEVVIWETNDPQKYASKVFVDKSGHNMSIYLLNGRILHFGRSEEGNWQYSSNKIILDLDKTSSTIGYDFAHHGETRTFTAKPGYQFKTVMVSKTLSEDHIFWEAERDDEWSNMVTVYGVETSVKNINIFLNNNKVEHFHEVDGKWVTKTTIVLDIDKNTDNDLFEYRSTRNFGHFNPKPNLTIEKIVKKDLEIWTAKPDDHGLKAVLMGSGKDEKFLSILLQSGNFVLLRKCGKGQCWEDITKEKSDFSGIKMYSLEEGTSKYHELTKNDYDPIVFESRYGYEFKEGVKCVKITYNDKTMWNHTDDPEFGYLKGLYLDLPKDQFSVTNLRDQTKHLTKAVTTVALDIEKTQSTDLFYYSDKNGVITYAAKSGHVFNKVSQGTTDIWESINNVCGTLVRTMTSDGVKYLAILLDNNMFMLFHLENNTWKDITSTSHDVTKLKFIGENDLVLTSSDYRVTIVDLSFTYIFNDGVECRKVKLGDLEVWKDSDDPEFSSIMKFRFGLLSNNFYVLNSDNETKKLEFKPTPETAAVITTVSVTKPAEPTKVTADISKTESTSEFEYTDQNGVVTYTPKDDHVFTKVTKGSTDIWESKTNVFGTLVRTKVSKGVKFLVVLLTNNMFTVFQEDGGTWKDITSDRHDVKKLRFFGDNDAEITTSDYSVSIVDLSFTYIFKDGVKCKKVKFGDDEVWKHTDDSNFADIKSFSLGLSSNAFFVKNQSDQVKKIEKEAEEPEPTPVTPAPEEEAPEATPPATTPETQQETTPAEPTVTKVTLDIEKTQSTGQFDYTEHNGIVTYRVKPGHGFTKVTQGSWGIWEYKDLCGRLVRTKLFSNNERFLAIILYNNSFRLFRQSEEDTSWEDITSERLDVTKLRFLSHNDRGLRNIDLTVSFVDFFYSFNFRIISRCLKVKYGNQNLKTAAGTSATEGTLRGLAKTLHGNATSLAGAAQGDSAESNEALKQKAGENERTPGTLRKLARELHTAAKALADKVTGADSGAAQNLATAVGVTETASVIRQKLKELSDETDNSKLQSKATGVTCQYGQVSGAYTEVQGQNAASKYDGDKQPLYQAVDKAWEAFNDLYNADLKQLATNLKNAIGEVGAPGTLQQTLQLLGDHQDADSELTSKATAVRDAYQSSTATEGVKPKFTDLKEKESAYQAIASISPLYDAVVSAMTAFDNVYRPEELLKNVVGENDQAPSGPDGAKTLREALYQLGTAGAGDLPELVTAVKDKYSNFFGTGVKDRFHLVQAQADAYEQGNTIKSEKYKELLQSWTNFNDNYYKAVSYYKYYTIISDSSGKTKYVFHKPNDPKNGFGGWRPYPEHKANSGGSGCDSNEPLVHAWIWHFFDILIVTKIYLEIIFIYSLHYRDSNISRAIINQPKMSTFLSIVFYIYNESHLDQN
ncbi:SfiI-subtelomeric fragment related protein family member, putative [Theileria annulata]|uniref:SfiI-subtelomeric related protein family member, putative n=1 Tax=Theileria annulata TaxID=5874 RepID=Q4UIZ2_THEAN|nr:SfiI-subtelomeric fragment related protein family member, putative [Theileria annulata]CAI72947.1 SfiI-subtelomeric fragment related protein family member, putative [Theileria annulata]